MSKQLRRRALLHLFLAAFGLLMLMPFGWMISTSLKDFGSVFLYPPRWIPDPVEWGNYPKAFSAFPFTRYFLNTSIVTVCRVLGTLLTASMGAYAFARLGFPGRDAIFLLYLATLMVPFHVVMIPLFVIMKKFGWLDSYAALIVPGIFTAFGTFLLRQSFLTVPESLEEAAFIDGATPWQIYIQIILPISKPALATLSVLTFIGSWNDFLWPLIVLNRSEMLTLTLGLVSFQGFYFTEWNLLMAGAVIVLTPTVIIYLLAQRYIVEGIAMTGLKY